MSPRSRVPGSPSARSLRVLAWHVHGSWMSAFVRGRHQVLLPTLPEGGPWGGGKAGRDWPGAREVPVEELRSTEVDVVVLQRVEEISLTERWLGRRPGRDVPAVFVEHNTPRGAVPETRHPLADQSEITLVHVTHFNALMWDSGRAPTVVVEHGVVDPGHRYTGELDAAAVVVNEPVRRGRVAGTDLLARLAEPMPLDVFGMGLSGIVEAAGASAGRIRPIGDLDQHKLHTETARRRLYLHPMRWTSLGLSLIEAMTLGMPVVALACTEVIEAVPPHAGVVSTDPERLVTALADLRRDRAAAEAMGRGAREAALRRYGLTDFLTDWDHLLAARAAG